ncbi:imidazole glycerol phosphate synthase subunit HisH [Patescibacteria group bacterium]|nr:imidazole glycerol phosphate synthase subunit HisH [Patescibacteria group bacterium]
MIALIDYNMGNLQSVVNAFQLLREDMRVTQNPEDVRKADAIVLPGVGAFGDGMKNLDKLGLIPVLQEEVRERKKPFLGICLGMQLAAREGTEHGIHQGLGWLDGRVERIEPGPSSYKIPHMGWNNLFVKKDTGLFSGIEDAVYYFVHSYSFCPAPGEEESVAATCWHGKEVVAAVEKENIFGVQFHPEKSQGAGLKLLENFLSAVFPMAYA